MTTAESELPQHVGIILDGNRRWAKEQGVPTLDGHRRGAEVFKDIALGAFDEGVKYLSAFVFSTENWQRTEEEVSYLMKLVVRAVEKYLNEFNERGIKILVSGNRQNLSKTVQDSINRTIEKTKNNTNGCLVLCFNYGGHQEIADAVKKIIASGIAEDAVTTDVIEQNLYSPEVPSLDLLIRTSGEQRTSGFMLWRAAYSELYFTDKYWPDFTADDFNQALEEYKQRNRRYGK
jgi:undecaprenyl diphosphate synthase